MEFKDTLLTFKKRFDPVLEAYLDERIAEATEKDPFIGTAMEDVKDVVMAGGKRLRPAMMYWGYRGCGGKDDVEIIRSGMSIELIHTFLLIHDDIIDRDELRHGVPSLHSRFEQLSKSHYPNRDHAHFGASIGIIVGDMVAALGNHVLFSSAFPPEDVLNALRKLQEIISYTVIGEAKDVVIEMEGMASEEEVLKMYEYKTARYTYEGPLHLGAILAGERSGVLEEMTALSVPLGVAFQIQDDILGIWGDQKRLGKPVGSDIREGKITVLVSHVLRNGTTEQKKELLTFLGSQMITAKDMDRVREIMKISGAFDYAKELGREFIDKGMQAIDQSSLNKSTKQFLFGASEYMLQREY